MKVLLIDSDVLIEVSRGRDRSVLARWEEVGQGDFLALCSPVTVAELWRGVRPHEHLGLKGLLSTMICIPIDAEVGQRAGDYLRQFSRSHGLEVPDALIAATASIHSLLLWTRNRRHYPMKDIAFYY